MPAEQALPKDHPLMKAWEKYKASEGYANSLKWARTARVQDHPDGAMTLTYPHTEGSMWAAFCAGYDDRYGGE
jgi:hypothetical protein